MQRSYKIVVIGLSLHRRGGVASVLATFAGAGFFNSEDVIYHCTCGDGSKFDKLLSFVKQWVKFLGLLIAERPDLAHIHFSADSSFWRKVPYILLAKLFRLKLLLNVHPTHFYDYFLNVSRPAQWMMKAVLGRADCLGFANANLITAFRPYFPRMRMAHLPNPINLSKYYPPSLPQRRLQALYLGAILPSKGVYDIVKAAEMLKTKRLGLCFVFCGDYETDKLQKEIDRLGLGNIVKVSDWVSYKTKLALLQQSSMLLLPSYSEGFSIVVLEAMACGLPVIAAPVGGLAGVLRDSENALLVEPGNPTMLAEKIDQLLSDAALRDKLAVQGLELVKQYDVRLVMLRLRDLYQDIITTDAEH